MTYPQMTFGAGLPAGPSIREGDLDGRAWTAGPIEGTIPGLEVPSTRVEPELEPEPDPQTHDHLFTLNGRKYYVPKFIAPNIAFSYLRDVKRRGTEYALAAVLERLLGEDGLNALADYEGMTNEQMTQLMDAIGDRVMGALQGK